MDSEVETVIDNIRKNRIAKRLSIVQLSVDSGISRSHLYYIETKKTIPALDTLAKIAHAMGIRMQDLFNDETPAAALAALPLRPPPIATTQGCGHKSPCH